MNKTGKYHIIEAATHEACESHRALVRDALDKSGIDPALADLLGMNEEDGKKTDEEGKGKSGKKSSGGGGGGGASHGDGEERNEVQQVESLPLLFFLAGQTCDQPFTPEAHDPTGVIPVAAATLLYDAEMAIAQVNEPYMPNQVGDHGPNDLLPAIEHHATTLGARMMELNVHLDAVALFQAKYGYKPSGQTFIRGGIPMQRMKKTLARFQNPNLVIS